MRIQNEAGTLVFTARGSPALFTILEASQEVVIFIQQKQEIHNSIVAFHSITLFQCQNPGWSL